MVTFDYYSQTVCILNKTSKLHFALWLWSSFIPFRGHGDNFLHTFTWLEVFSMFTVWDGLFSLVLMFSGLRIEALPKPHYRVKCIYTIS